MAGTDTGRWVPLRHYLRLKRGRQSTLELSFRQIEEVIGDGLPKPARKYREWWQNEAANEQARAWLETGWRVQILDLAAERVTFEAADDQPAGGAVTAL